MENNRLWAVTLSTSAIIEPAHSACSHSGGLCDVGVDVSAVSQGERGPAGPAAVGPRGVPGIPGERGESVSAETPPRHVWIFDRLNGRSFGGHFAPH